MARAGRHLVAGGIRPTTFISKYTLHGHLEDARFNVASNSKYALYGHSVDATNQTASISKHTLYGPLADVHPPNDHRLCILKSLHKRPSSVYFKTDAMLRMTSAKGPYNVYFEIDAMVRMASAE